MISQGLKYAARDQLERIMLEMILADFLHAHCRRGFGHQGVDSNSRSGFTPSGVNLSKRKIQVRVVIAEDSRVAHIVTHGHGISIIRIIRCLAARGVPATATACWCWSRS